MSDSNDYAKRLFRKKNLGQSRTVPLTERRIRLV
jgi:hypothetical protein